jgi:hypothetical protein
LQRKWPALYIYLAAKMAEQANHKYLSEVVVNSGQFSISDRGSGQAGQLSIYDRGSG